MFTDVNTVFYNVIFARWILQSVTENRFHNWCIYPCSKHILLQIIAGDVWRLLTSWLYWLQWQLLLLLWKDCSCMYIDYSESNTSYYLCCMLVIHAEVSQNFNTTLAKAQIFFNVVSFTNSFLPPLTKGTCSHLVKVALCQQSLAHGVTQCLGVLASCLSYDQIGGNQIVWTYCRVGVATLSIQIFWWPQ